ncbi:MAG TPA: NAD(P)/FAD-dependent oxidoreductase [Longimicrobiales bacterium]|nr:NAD(P)/FAD-dependent oxidoreductase [Longimicrobiales bacterium]
MTDHRRGRGRANPRIAVVGAGVSGITVAVMLKRAGFSEFEVFEAADEIGGTWRQNRYPGASVDIPSELYQFSFHRHLWTRTHGTQAQLFDYLRDTVETFELRDHIRLSEPVDEVRWDDQQHLYHVTTRHGVTRDFEVVVSCLGFLDDPKYPQWPGLEEFEGEIFHTANWPEDLDLSGRRVAVVGVGSTAVQVVPAIQPVVESVTVFQRTPGWVLPKGERDYSPEEMARPFQRLRRNWVRWKSIAAYEWHYVTGPVYYEGNRRNRKAEAAARDYINRTFADRPELRDAVTPDYAFSGKRRVLSDDYYPTLLKPNVTLVPHAVQRVTSKGLVDVEGTEHEFDVIVMATGFKASQYLSKLRVYGRDGLEIQEKWSAGPYALAGVTVDGFPNFYMMYGPNTNGAGSYSVMALVQNQAKWVIRNLRRMRRTGASALDTDPVWVRRYNDWLQRRLRRTAWASSDNYMKAANGRIVTQLAAGISMYKFLLASMRLVATRELPRRAEPGAAVRRNDALHEPTTTDATRSN